MAPRGTTLTLLPPVPVDPVGDVRRLRDAGQRPPPLQLIRSLHAAHHYAHAGRDVLRDRRVAVSRDLRRPGYEIVRMLALPGARPAAADARRVDAVVVSDDPALEILERASSGEIVLIGEEELAQLARAVSTVVARERLVLDQLLQRVRDEAPVLGRRQDGSERTTVSSATYARRRLAENERRRGIHLRDARAKRAA